MGPLRSLALATSGSGGLALGPAARKRELRAQARASRSGVDVVGQAFGGQVRSGWEDSS